MTNVQQYNFDNLSDLLDSLSKPNLVVLASRPSMGKTNLALNFVFEKISAGIPVAIFSPELSEKQIRERLRNIATTNTDEPKVFIDDTPQISIEALTAKVHHLQKSENIGLIIVDYIQLMRADGQKTRTAEASKIADGLKSLTAAFKIPVIALSQLSRDLETREDKRPQLTDFPKENQPITNTADVIMFLYRDAHYNKSALAHEASEPAELLIVKSKTGKMCCTVLGYNRESLKFSTKLK